MVAISGQEVPEPGAVVLLASGILAWSRRFLTLRIQHKARFGRASRFVPRTHSPPKRAKPQFPRAPTHAYVESNFLSVSLRADGELALAPIQNDADALEYAADEVQNDPELKKIAKEQ